jgi:hypothetical protein
MINWKEQQALAKAMGISPSFVNDILHRRRPCPVKRAQDMSNAYYILFGVFVPYHEFTFNKDSANPVFKEKEPVNGGRKTQSA